MMLRVKLLLLLLLRVTGVPLLLLQLLLLLLGVSMQRVASRILMTSSLLRQSGWRSCTYWRCLLLPIATCI